MGRPSKSTAVLSAEGKSHRTKAELAARAQAEQEALSGKKMQEHHAVKSDSVAHGVFLRVRKLFEAVGKDDALYEAVVNRYAQLQSEIRHFEQLRTEAEGRLARMDDDDGGVDRETYYKLVTGMQKTILDYDKQIQAKRKMCFDIEKENAMTVAAAMRSIPKAPAEKNSELKAALGL